MQKLIYDINNTRVIIKGTKVICKNKLLKEKIEVFLQNEIGYGPEKGFHPFLSEVFGKNIKLISEAENKKGPFIIY